MMSENEKRSTENIRLLKLVRNGDESAAAELVKINMGLVKKLALRFCDRGTEYEDLVQIGSIGMLKAIRTFDEKRGTAFSTYAVPLIMGEIRKHLRDDGLIKISRVYKQMGAKLLFAKERFFSDHGREPSIVELADELGVDAEEVAIALDALLPVHSLNEQIYGEEDSATLESIICADESEIDTAFDKMAIADAIAKMPALWQKIVILRFFRDMTQQKCAESLGLSQVKISREEKKIVAFLRGELS